MNGVKAVSMQCLEAAFDGVGSQDPPSRCFAVDSGIDVADLVALEQLSNQPPRGLIDGNHSWLRGHLQSDSQARRLADHAAVLRPADQIVDDDRTCRNSNPALQRDPGADLKRCHGRAQRKSGVHRLLDVVLMRNRMSKICDDRIADMLGDGTVEEPTTSATQFW
jgi:hypothetical protein